MPKKAKNPPIKRVFVTRRSGALKPEDKAGYAHQVQTDCTNSPVYNGSTTLKTVMGAWISAADALAANLASQTALRTSLATLVAAEAGLVVDCDNGEGDFASAVQTAAKDDVTVATGMGMGVRADRAPEVAAAVPTGVRVTLLKKNGAPRLKWDPVDGASKFLAQMSVDPATETSWAALYGPGKSRVIPPLVPGQHYLFRVAALDVNGKPTGWSTTVSFVG